MALKKNISVTGKLEGAIDNIVVELENHVVDFGECYVTVKSVSGGKNIKSTAVVRFDNTVAPFEKVYRFDQEMTNENAIAQAYDHLKTLPEFADAIDC